MDLVDEFLEHYGVPGMKWGKRKSSPSSREIKEARGRHNDRAQRINRNVEIGSKTYDKVTQKRAAQAIRKIGKEDGAEKDASVGARLTKGERFATYMVVGPLAPLVNSKAQKNRQAYTEAFIKSAANVKVQEFYDLDKA